MPDDLSIPQSEDLWPEIKFKTSRSSGPGGQHVNKVNTRVTLVFDIPNSTILKEEQKSVLLKKLTARLSNEGILMIHSQEKRSQLQNKDAAVDKFNEMLTRAFKKKKLRKPTKPSRAAIKKRKETKKKISEKKERRRKPV